MSLNLLTLFFITINLFSVWGELPQNVILFSFFSLILGLMTHKYSHRSFIKVGLLFFAIFLIRFSFQKVSSAEGAISFVLILSTLKFWELKNENDHFNMFLILCLSETGIFLINPSFTLFIFGVLKIFFYLYYILKLRNYDLSSISVKRLVLLILPSLIFSFVLFYTFPRFTQGFLNVSGNFQIPQTGLSDVIDIKFLGPLNLSGKKVFKVYLGESDLKPSINIYWRQNVLWNYYDGAWRTSEHNIQIPEKFKHLTNLSDQHPINSLRFVLEETFSQEFISLDGYQSQIENKNQGNHSIYYYDQTIRSRSSFKPQTQYILNYGSGLLQQHIDPFLKRKSLKIKIKDTFVTNIQKTYLANILESDQDEIKLNKLIVNFRKKNFSYSLNPPQYSSTEDFLMNGKSGYCSHFAAAFGVLTRLSGIPSRLVSGYLGSQYNAYDNSLIIKELDAHVWVEVFLENKGWVRIDPTELVIPSRLELSAQDFNNQQQAFALPKIQFLSNIGLWFDALNSRFNETIFGYDQDTQENLLSFKSLKNIKLHYLFLGSLICFCLFYFLIFALTKKKEAKHVLRYKKFLKHMKRYGLDKQPHETASQFSQRCLQNKSINKEFITNETNLYLSKEYLEKF